MGRIIQKGAFGVLIFLLMPVLCLAQTHSNLLEGSFFVHVGAYKTYAHAEAKLNQLCKYGFSCFIKKINIAGSGTGYGVCLGPYKSFNIANNEANQAFDSEVISYKKIGYTTKDIAFLNIKEVKEKTNRAIPNPTMASVAQMKSVDDEEMASICSAGLFAYLEYGILEETLDPYGDGPAKRRLFKVGKNKGGHVIGLGTQEPYMGARMLQSGPLPSFPESGTVDGHVEISDHFVIVDGDGVLTPAQKLTATKVKADPSLYENLFFNTLIGEWEGTTNIFSYFNDYYIYMPYNGAVYLDNFYLDMDLEYELPLMIMAGPLLYLDDINLFVDRLAIDSISIGSVGIDPVSGDFTHNKGPSIGRVEIMDIELSISAKLKGR